MTNVEAPAPANQIDPTSAWLRRGWGPVETGVGLTVLEAAPGRVRFMVPFHTGLVDPRGYPVPGLVGGLVDSASAVTAYSALGANATGPTVELRIDLAAPVTPGSTCLFADGFALRADVNVATTRLVLRDEAGVEIGHVMGMHGVEHQATAPEESWPLFAEKFNPADVKVSLVADSVLRVALTPGMLNGRGGLHGGVLAAIAQVAQTEHHRLEGQPVQVLHVGIEYLKPIALEGAVECRSTTLRNGRRFRTVRTELVRPDGMVAAVAHGSAVTTGAVRS